MRQLQQSPLLGYSRMWDRQPQHTTYCLCIHVIVSIETLWSTVNCVCLASLLVTSSTGSVQSIVMCLFVCLSVDPLVYLRNHKAELHQFLCMLAVAVAQSSPDGVAIRYVLPVLWMTSCFHLVGSIARHVYS